MEADADVRSLEDHVATVRLKDEDGGGVVMAVAPDVGDGLGDDNACDAQERCLPTEEDVEKDKGCGLAVKLADSVEDISALSEVRGQISEDKGSRIDERHMDMDEEESGGFPVESPDCGNLQTCHVANGRLSSKTLCVICGETFCSKDVCCVCDALNKATKRKQHEQEGLAGNGGDWVGVAEVKATIQDLQLGCDKTHYVNEGLSDAINHDSEQWPRGVDGVIFMTDDYYELKQDDLMPEIEVQISRTLHEDSVPSVSGSIDVSLDGKAGCVGEIFGNSVACHATDGVAWNKGLCAPFGEGSQSMYSECMHGMVDKVTEESQCEEGGLADEGGVLCDGVLVEPSLDGPSLMADAGDELETDVFLSNIDAEVSCPVDEASAPSIYKSPMDAPLDGKAGWDCEISENRSLVEKLTEVSGDETRHCRMDISKWLPSSLCKDANMVNVKTCGPFAEIEVPLQQADQKSEPFELPPERDPTISSYNQPCEDALFCTDKESPDLFLGHQGSSGVELGSLDSLAQDLNTCNSINDEPCSVDFVKIGNDGGLQSQKSEPLIVFRRRNPRRAASSRNCNVEKHDQMNKGINSTRKSKKVEGLRSLVQSTMLMFPNKTTKGRSGINRPLKSTAWGSLQKLTDGFGQNCGPSTSNSHQTCLERGRSNKRPAGKLQPSIRKTRSSRCSKKKCPRFSDMVHSSDEFNMQHTFSVTTDTTASSEGHIRNLPKFAPHELVKVSHDAPITAQCMPMQTDTEQFNRCLEGIVPEICPAYINGECAKSTSEPSLNNADVGFSPDSVLEVASVTCESNTSASQDIILHENLSYPAALTGGDLHASASSASYFGKSRALSSTDLEHRAKTVRGEDNTRKEEINPPQAIIVKNIGEGKLQSFEMSDAVRNNKTLGKLERQKKDGTKGKNFKNRNSTKISSVETSNPMAFSNGSSELLLCTAPPKSGSCFEVVTSATQHVGVHEHDSTQGPFATDKEKWCVSDNVESPRCKKKDGLGSTKGKARNPHMKGKGKRKNIADDMFVDSGSFSLPSHLATDLVASHTNEQNGTSVPLPHRAAWACCDDCQKWRCIPAELADIIGETNCRWTCKDNRDKAFADCSIPQEKTNAEINTELELSDASADEADNEGSNSKASEAPSWTHVKENSFSHRSRRKQSIDESMVCNCKPPQDGRMGCGDGCLNRMLNIECEKRTCPCGEKCSNQQFQRRNYANISWFRSGKKGYGLQLQEEVSEGHFLIEYVGEVLDIMTYESRQRYYASKGQKHFYFMALNGGEVIDACTKGNLGRFINHSCSPNCRTEKWMVNGEVCIGIFAMRNIKKGEELTFDYNYVRVSGAAPQKCFCGTSKCRGYIGGEISGSHIIAQDDAEAENFDLVTVDKDAEEMLGNVSCSQGPNSDIFEHGTSILREDSNDCPPATPESEHHQQSSPVLFNISEPENSLEASSPQDAEDITRTPVHVSRTIESSLQQSPVYGTPPFDILQKNSNPMDGLRASSVMSGSTQRSDPGSNLVSSFHANKKNKLKHHRNVKPSSSKVKPSSPIDNEHTLGVEGRLNNLLDEEGGIRARKDAAKGYLKLLLVTAAEGDNAGGTSQSVRDISLILDALLKTKSHAVLLDIISKNGLQMLQNILKQNRSNFLRTPIIRKLLKVLEFLVLRKILTSEDINGGPRCAGMESFRDSMLSLIWHRNAQVQQIARNFRDKWITPNLDGPISKSNYYTNSSSLRRKRKSRWDYQPESHYKMIGLKIQKVFSGHGELDVQTSLMKNKSQGNLGASIYHNYVPGMGSSPNCADDEVPPGFEPRQECGPAQASLEGVVAPGFCQERYLPNLSISYGIPVALVHHFGTPEVGGQCGKKWKVAPGVPFNPFPPLPPYPRGSPCPSTSSSQMSHHDGTLVMKHNSSSYQGRTVDRGRMHRNWQNEARTRFPGHRGRRFPSNRHIFERCQPPRPQEHGD